jgi:hypothetical protein
MKCKIALCILFYDLPPELLQVAFCDFARLLKIKGPVCNYGVGFDLAFAAGEDVASPCYFIGEEMDHPRG